VFSHGILTLLVLAATLALNIYLYVIIPKGFFPQQDTGRLIGNIQADQGISFQAMQKKLATFVDTVRADPAVESVVAFTGGGQRNGGSMFVGLKPLSERRESADAVIARLRGKLANEPGANLFLQSAQDIRIGGRQANAQYQFTLQADDLAELRQWEPRIRRALSDLPELADVNTDQQDKGAQTTLNVDRDTATRLGVTMADVDSTLNDWFGQRQVSTIYNPLNQYHVVMEAAPQYWQSPESLRDIYVSAGNGTNAATGATGSGGASNAVSSTSSTSSNSSTASTATTTATATAANAAGIATTAGGPQVPLSAFASYGPTNTPLAVNHQGQFAASTISFNLPEGVSLSDATRVVNDALARLGAPSSVHGTFQGTARAFQASLDSQPWLILAALITVYIVLGILYESYVHPITILSTLPSAGVGALLALLAFKTEFSLMALIGVILLIGIVKKNAIMMIDYALEVERSRKLAPREAIFDACLRRFRPIMMTTLAAMLGALPLALGTGDGAELRRPLGISIVGGLLVSQLLTLYTTPVVYLYLDRFRLWALRHWRRASPSTHAPIDAQAQRS
jgi:multidrug efflux pump